MTTYDISGCPGCDCGDTTCTTLELDCPHCPRGVASSILIAPEDLPLILFGADQSGGQPDSTLTWAVEDFKLLTYGGGLACDPHCCWGMAHPFFPSPSSSNQLLFHFDNFTGNWEIDLSTAAGNFPIGYTYRVTFTVSGYDCCAADQIVSVSFVGQSGSPFGGGGIPPYGYQTPYPTQFRIKQCSCPTCDTVDWSQIHTDNGSTLYLSLPCANTPTHLGLTWDGSHFSFASGAWGTCADDFTNLRLDCNSETGSFDPLSNIPQITGIHGGVPFRVPILIVSLNPFYATFFESPFDSGDTNTNEPCGGCGGGSGMYGFIEP